MRWDLIPLWVKDQDQFDKKHLMTNARGEEITETKSYRDLLPNVRNRCLVPIDGWYDYFPEGKVPSGVKKQPYYYTRADGEIGVMAGLWTAWPGPKAKPLETPTESYTIITYSAGETKPIHSRIPVILRDKDEVDLWLDPDAQVRDLINLLVTPADGMIKTWPIAKGVLSVKNPGPEILEPIAL